MPKYPLVSMNVCGVVEINMCLLYITHTDYNKGPYDNEWDKGC